MKADWKDVVCAVVICEVWKLAIVLQLFVVMTYKWAMNPIANPKPCRESVIHVAICIQIDIGKLNSQVRCHSYCVSVFCSCCNVIWECSFTQIWVSEGYQLMNDRHCGLVVRVPGYRSRGPRFDSRRYQIFWEVVGLERGPQSHEDNWGAT
jgi:hypothetical protein